MIMMVGARMISLSAPWPADRTEELDPIYEGGSAEDMGCSRVKVKSTPIMRLVLEFGSKRSRSDVGFCRPN